MGSLEDEAHQDQSHAEPERDQMLPSKGLQAEKTQEKTLLQMLVANWLPDG